MSHFVRGQLAEQYGARVVEPGRRRGVVFRNAIEKDARVARGQDALRVVDVLQRERDPVERATIPARADLGLGLLRLLAGQIERARDERVRLSVVLLDAPDQRLDQLEGRQLSGGDQARELGNREVVEFSGHGG